MPNWAGLVLVRAALPRPHQRRRASSTPTIERYWMGPQSEGDRGRRRPLRRRRRARRAAPALRPLLAQGAVRPGLRLARPSRSAACSTRGYIQAYAYTDDARLLRRRPPRSRRADDALRSYRRASRSPASSGKMGKSLKNVGDPRRDVRASTAPTRCASTRCSPARSTRAGRGTPSAVVGMYRLLQRIWRVVRRRGRPATSARRRRATPDDETRRVLHRTIAAVRDGMETLRFNTSIARITELTNHLTADLPRRRRAPRGRPSRSCCCWPRSPRTSPRSCGRGWATPSSLACAGLPRRRRAVAGRRHRRGAGPGQRQGPRPHHRRRRRRRRGARGRGPRRREGRRPARRRDRPQGHRRPGKMVNFVVG